jgi:hypothetical protein
MVDALSERRFTVAGRWMATKRAGQFWIMAGLETKVHFISQIIPGDNATRRAQASEDRSGMRKIVAEELLTARIPQAAEERTTGNGA